MNMNGARFLPVLSLVLTLSVAPLASAQELIEIGSAGDEALADVTSLEADEHGVAHTGEFDEMGRELVLVPVLYRRAADGSIEAHPALARRGLGTAGVFGLEAGTLGAAFTAGYIIGRFDPEGGVMAGAVTGLLIEGGLGTRGAEVALGWASFDFGAQALLALRVNALRSWQQSPDRGFRGTYVGADGTLGFFLVKLRAGAAYRIDGPGSRWIFRGGIGIMAGF